MPMSHRLATTSSHRGALPKSVDVREAAHTARQASRVLATLSADVKNAVLREIAKAIEDSCGEVLRANAKDIQSARESGLAAAKLQRLELTEKSLGQLAEGVRQVAALPDPVGAVTTDRTLASGLRVRKVRSPLGVIAMIYEARPGVTVDAFALCFKAGNACILRGGKEAERSNAVLSGIIGRVLEARGVPEAALVNLSGTSREALATLLTIDKDIDLVIPRGGRELIELVCSISRIPTIQHFQGVCHVYVDESADLDMAVAICLSAKTSAPATCNALECILVHKNISDQFVPRMVEQFAKAGVQVRGTPLVQALAPAEHAVDLAQPEDFGKEFLDLIVAMRTVDSVDEAIEHIACYGSNHTEAIVTGDLGPGGAANRFCARVQSSCTLVNASTRFNDGFQLGLGAEIGISTSRLHAYGPMGLEELTTQRYVVIGSGQTR
jgi:glutamate-5-semialdehyde dehydrogenase